MFPVLICTPELAEHIYLKCVFSVPLHQRLKQDIQLAFLTSVPVPESDIKEVEPNSSVKPLFSSKIE